MKRIRFEFPLSAKNIADIISNATPLDGATISKPVIMTKAGADTGGIFVQITIQFIHDAHDLIIGILGAWLYDRIKEGKKKCHRINNQTIVLNKRNIRRLIKRELANQIAREKQRRNDKNRPPKKRS